MRLRVIPRLDIKGPNLVKGVHLEGLRVLGPPERFAQHYYEQGADELLYMDVVASLYGRNSILDAVERTSRALFIPLTVGGGLRTLDDIRDVLRAGADKVAINTAAVCSPEFISDAARRFGSSTIVVSVEAIARPQGGYQAFTDNGREETGLDAVEWAVRATELGAGELMITSVDREGTGRGYDLHLTQQIAEAVDVPVIACGGAGRASDVVAVAGGHADAVAIASILHYRAVEELGVAAGEIGGEGNVEYLRKVRPPQWLEPIGLQELKQVLVEAGVPCRPAEEAIL